VPDSRDVAPPVEDLLARLERERLDADRRYNAALTALDRLVQPPPTLPTPEPQGNDGRVPEINREWKILPDGTPETDTSVKGRLRTFIWRLVGPPLEQQQKFNALVTEYINRDVERSRQLSETVGRVTAALEREGAARAEFQAHLIQYLQTITAYVDSKDRSSGTTEIRQRLALNEERLLALKRLVESSSPASARVAPPNTTPVFSGELDSVTYAGFEDRFRGSEEEIRSRVDAYVPIFSGASNVLDVGCGRGELLSGLREAGITARGIDISPAMVERCRGRNLQVERSDALPYLERLPVASLGGLVAIQVVEHFDPAYLVRFLAVAYHALRPGAAMVLETVNPSCWMAFFETYLRDLTHQRALHPDTLRFLVESSGFTAVDVQFRSPIGESDRLDRVKIAGDSAGALPRNLAQLADTVNSHADKLNARLFSYMDYVVIGRR
jgi:O-antigen chain-terminating methyltransferase